MAKETIDPGEDFTRDELMELRDKAKELSRESHVSELWKRAYIALEDAADKLDAMIARSTEQE